MTTYCEAEDCAYNWEGKCAAAGDACGVFNSLWTGKPIMELIKHESKREPILPPDGQITIDGMEV